jgi:hypothetical protein
MTDQAAIAHGITTAHLDELRIFIAALEDEADKDTSGPAARRPLRLLFGTLAYGPIGYLSATVESGASWTEGDDRRWWLLLQIADAYKDHPGFPNSIRPFLGALG